MAMKIEDFLWFNSGTSDKIWGIVAYNGSLYSFWGRRNASLKVKRQGNITGTRYYCIQLVQEKKDKGYKTVPDSQRKIDPTLPDRLEQALVLSSLKSED